MSISNGALSPTTLITGSAGFLGRALVGSLSKDAHPTVCVYRNRLPDSHQQVFPFRSDLDSVDLLSTPLRDIDTVVHLAWSHINLEKDLVREADASFGNLGMLDVLLRAMEKAGTRRIVFLSHMNAGSHASSTFLRTKYWAENLILNSSIPEKRIIRSSIVVGGGREAGEFLLGLRVLCSIPLIFPDVFRGLVFRPVWLHDAVLALKRAIMDNQRSCSAELKEVTGDYELTSRDLVEVGSILTGASRKMRFTGPLADWLASIALKRKTGQVGMGLTPNNIKTMASLADRLEKRELSHPLSHSPSRSREDFVRLLQGSV